MNKRGQFFIIAAIFVVLILFGISGASNYLIVKKEPTTILDLSSELNRETYNVIEYGIYNNENLTSLADSFVGEDIADYFLKKTDNANIVFVYGNKSDLITLHYQTANTGTISIGESDWEVYNTYSKRGKVQISGDSAEVEILGNQYSFKLNDNELFYFVIVQKEGDEVIIERDKASEDEEKPGFEE